LIGHGQALRWRLNLNEVQNIVFQRPTVFMFLNVFPSVPVVEPNSARSPKIRAAAFAI